MTAQDWTEVVGAIGVFTLVIVVSTVSIWQFAITRRATATLAREQEYRDLAEAAVRTQQTTERLLAELVDRVTAAQSRLDSFERILREVE